MRIAVLSDIHSNLPALEAVLIEIDREGIQDIFCLGDIVGYCADPAPCIDLIRERCTLTVGGNHDLAVATGVGLEFLPTMGQIAAEHNASAISEDQSSWLEALPLLQSQGDMTYAHASPQYPERWMRIESFFLAQEQFKNFDTSICFVGHTHLPGVLSEKLGVLRVRKDHRFIINVGSVGQPRDGDPRACVAFFDPDSFDYELRRIPYNVDRTAARIREEGLPDSLARRLESGA